MKGLIFATLFVAQVAFSQPVAAPVGNVAQRVLEDAIVLERVAQASRRDLPRDLLRRIVDEDIDLMRGLRSDGTYQYATFERFDSGRFSQSFSINPNEKEMRTVEVKGAWVYRVLLEVPGRRLVVRRNLPVWIERVDMDYISERGTQSERHSVEIKAWMQPGEFRTVDIPAVARQATVRVIASVDPKGGYGNVNIDLLKARIVDNSDSPYAEAVASAKSIQRALDNNDTATIRAMANRMRSSLSRQATDVLARVDTPPPAALPSPALAPPSLAPSGNLAGRLEMQVELQLIEDLLTGSEQERRDGMDRLHQLIRRLRQ